MFIILPWALTVKQKRRRKWIFWDPENSTTKLPIDLFLFVYQAKALRAKICPLPDGCLYLTGDWFPASGSWSDWTASDVSCLSGVTHYQGVDAYNENQPFILPTVLIDFHNDCFVCFVSPNYRPDLWLVSSLVGRFTVCRIGCGRYWQSRLFHSSQTEVSLYTVIGACYGQAKFTKTRV